MPVQTNPVPLVQIVLTEERDAQSTTLPRITPSCLADLPCSKRYDATRVSKTAWQKKRRVSIWVPRGSAYHTALHALHYQRRGCELPVHDLPMFCHQAVRKSRYEWDANLEEEQQIVQAMAELFLRFQDPEDVAAIVGLEEQAEFDLVWKGKGLACMSATIDRLLVRPDDPTHLVLQDYKSGNRKLDMQEAFLILWCARNRWPQFKTLTLEYLWLDMDEQQVYIDVITTDMAVKHQKYLIAAVEHAIRGEPTEEPGPVCTWCPIRKFCQSGTTVTLEQGEMVF